MDQALPSQVALAHAKEPRGDYQTPWDTRVPAGPDASEAEVAEQLGVRPAKLWVRSLAFLIDAIIWALLVSPAAIATWLYLEQGLSFAALILLIVGASLPAMFCVVQIVLHGRRGVTVGKAAMKLRSVSLPGLSRPGFWRIVLRSLLLTFSNLLPIMGPVLLFSSSYWDASGRNRSLLDRAASCWLIDVSEGIDPTNRNVLRRARRSYDAQFRDISEPLPKLSYLSARSAASVIGAAPEQWATQSEHTDRGAVIDSSSVASWVFVFDDASHLTITSFGLLGRTPQQLTGRAIGQLVAIQDPKKLLSKTHLAFGADEHGAWVEDLGSSNGTEVQAPGESHLSRLTAGEHVRLREGSIVQVGSRRFQLQREEIRA